MFLHKCHGKVAVIIVITFILIIAGCGNQEGEVDSSYDFTLQDLSGEDVTLSSYHGNVVLLKFWTIRCIHCVESLPHLEELQGEYPDLQVFAINVGEDEGTVKQFIANSGYTFPVLLDSQGDVAGQYRVRGVPTTALIDEEGELAYNRAGALSFENMQELVESQL